MKTFPESDWKKLGAIRDDALQRFCSDAIDTVRRKAEDGASAPDAHQAFLAVAKEADAWDQKLGRLFNDWRRSTAEITLTNWRRTGLVTDEEFDRFSDEVKDRVGLIMSLRNSG